MLTDFDRTRAGLLVINLSAIDIWLGDADVTSSTGILLLGVKGSAISISTTAPIWAVASSGTPAVSWMDLHD